MLSHTVDLYLGTMPNSARHIVNFYSKMYITVDFRCGRMMMFTCSRHCVRKYTGSMDRSMPDRTLNGPNMLYDAPDPSHFSEYFGI